MSVLFPTSGQKRLVTGGGFIKNKKLYTEAACHFLNAKAQKIRTWQIKPAIGTNLTLKPKAV
ncbi:hypothetical protein [Pontibacter russatus]|uniref:hypothetical protein n=1 Tax=Pontibacter russatus TaxID=2694929 RepID=UPI001379AE89|nr:hypothetical protein [Pontibacter russatus]